MAQYGHRLLITRLFNFTLRCSRCGSIWPDTCLDTFDSAASPIQSRHVEYLNREMCRQIQCRRQGCSRPTFPALLVRCVLWPFTRKPLFGYCRIVDTKVVSETNQLIGPHLDAVEIVNIQLAAMHEANRIIASTFKDRERPD
jgi:hypothetical protein